VSEEGPRLLSMKDGYAFAKFNGRKINFGRSNDPQACIRFAALKAQWEANDCELTDDLLEVRTMPGAVIVAVVCDQ